MNKLKVVKDTVTVYYSITLVALKAAFNEEYSHEVSITRSSLDSHEISHQLTSDPSDSCKHFWLLFILVCLNMLNIFLKFEIHNKRVHI